MSKERPLRCPECQGALHEIRVIDKAHTGVHTDLEYAGIASTTSFWTSRYPVEGKVEAYLCDGCRRILLYGAPLATE